MELDLLSGKQNMAEKVTWSKKVTIVIRQPMFTNFEPHLKLIK